MAGERKGEIMNSMGTGREERREWEGEGGRREGEREEGNGRGEGGREWEGGTDLSERAQHGGQGSVPGTCSCLTGCQSILNRGTEKTRVKEEGRKRGKKRNTRRRRGGGGGGGRRKNKRRRSKVVTLSVRLRSQPAVHKQRTISKWQFCAARCSGVEPSWEEGGDS